MPKHNVFKPSEKFDKITGIDYSSTGKGARIFRALNHKLRQRIIQIIHENKKLTVTEIYDRLGIVQAVASQQLRILRLAKIVSVTRIGQCNFYGLNYSNLELINNFLKSIVP